MLDARRQIICRYHFVKAPSYVPFVGQVCVHAVVEGLDCHHLLFAEVLDAGFKGLGACQRGVAVLRGD